MFELIFKNLSPTTIIAEDKDKTYTVNDFKNCIQNIYTQTQTCEKQTYILAIENCYLFAATFIALILQRKTCQIPPVIKESAISEIANQQSAIATDVPNNFKDDQNIIVISENSSKANQALNEAIFNKTIDLNLVVELFTSGTTGKPKRIQKTLNNFKSEIDQLENMWGVNIKNTLLIATVSHLHIYGFLFRLLWPLQYGHRFHIKTFLFPNEIIQFANRNTKLTLISSPAFLSRVPQISDIQNLCSTCNMITSSGGALSFDISEQYTNLAGITPIEIYGSTETGGIGYRQSIQNNTPWQLFNNVKMQINTNDNTLIVKSPYLFESSWFQTADEIEVISENQFKLLGRTDRIIKLEEKRISLIHLEEKIKATGFITECYVLFSKKSKDQNRDLLSAIMVPKLENWRIILQNNGNELQNQIRENLSTYFDDIAMPRKWRFVREIPKNTQGKINYELLDKFHDEASIKYPHILSKVSSNIDKEETFYTIWISPHLQWFKGHFEEYALLPGVVQLNWVVYLAKETFNLKKYFQKMNNIKFKKPILPGQIIQLNIKSNGSNQLNFQYEWHDEIYASGIIHFTDEKAN